MVERSLHAGETFGRRGDATMLLAHFWAALRFHLLPGRPSAVKRFFGGSVRSKLLTAQLNEVLAKCLCYNLTVLVHSFHELGVEPGFGSTG